MIEKLAQIARLLEVTPQVEAHGYDWPQIDRLLYDPEVQAAIHPARERDRLREVLERVLADHVDDHYWDFVKEALGPKRAA